MDANRIRFQGGSAFHAELKKRVDAYFDTSHKHRRDLLAMYVKTAFLFASMVVCYGLLVFAPVNWWQAIFLTIGLSFGMLGIAFSVQHDANHGGYSDRRWVNRILGYSLDMIGGSSYLWYWKHNVMHHTYTNISGADTDIDLEPLLRFAPDQPWRFFHRFQTIYVWFLYGLLPVHWHFLGDFQDLYNGHLRGRPFPRPTRLGLAGILFGKAVFFTWGLIIPMMLHPAWMVIGLYLVATFVMGVVLSIVFQCAHLVDEAEVTDVATYKPVCWAEHQIRTTSNFAPDNRFLTWFLGGLNHQVEHHLFPKICHIHYPALSKIVSSTCADFGLVYHSHPTFSAAIKSHIHRLWVLGRPSSQATLA